MMQTTKRIATVASFSGAWEVREEEEEGGESRAEEKRRSDIQDRQSHSSSNSLGMNLRDWLLLIPDYDGCPHRLDAFSSSLRFVAAELRSEKSERVLLLALGAKLRGRARELASHRLHRFSSVDEFLNWLSTRFGDAGKENELLEELGGARQASEESLQEYGARLDRLAGRLRVLYEDPRYGEVETNERLVGEMALTRFRRGLENPELEARLGAWDPRSLDEAVGIAVVLESEMRYREKMRRRHRGASSWSSYGRKRRY